VAIVVLLVVLAIIAGLLFFPTDDETALNFVTSEVTRGELTIQITATGTLFAVGDDPPLDQLFPRWGSRARPQRQNNKSKQVWILENDQPRAIEVQTGPSNGRMTQILTGELETGMAVITDATGKPR